MGKDCGGAPKNISKTNCGYNEKLPHGYAVSKVRGFKISKEDLKDKAKILALITSGMLYLFPKVVGSNADNTPDLEVEVNEFGYSFVADTTLNTALNLKIDTSSCMMPNLKSWDGLNVHAFKIDVNGDVNGINVIEDGVEYLQTQPTKFYFRKPKTRTSNKGELRSSMVVLMDNDLMDEKVPAPFILGLDGIIDLEFKLESVTATEIVVRAEEICNDNAVLGLDANLVCDQLDANNEPTTELVPSSVVDNLDSTYTLTFGAAVLPTGENVSVNLNTKAFSPSGTDAIYGVSTSTLVIPIA